MWIFQYLNLQCVPFLRQIVPALLTVMKRPDGTFRQKMLRELGGLVRLVRHHIRPYLDDIFALISQFWPNCLEATLQLATTIAAGLKDEFKLHLPKLIPLMLDVLTTSDRSRLEPSANTYVPPPRPPPPPPPPPPPSTHTHSHRAHVAAGSA